MGWTDPQVVMADAQKESRIRFMAAFRHRGCL